MKPERFRALDAWRGICALAVALEHFKVANILHTNRFVHYGYRFVDFFFVLSGFVIAHAYRDRLVGNWREVRGFLIRRVGRLWPLHITLLAIFVVVEIGLAIAATRGVSIGHDAFTDRNTPAALAANAVLAQGLGLFDRLTWNTPSWSISTEMFAYVTFAAMCAMVPARRLSIAALALIAPALVVLYFAPKGMGSTYDFGVFRCIYGFMVGVLVRDLWARRALRVGTLGEIAVVGLVIAAVIGLPLDAPAMLVTPVFALAVWVFASEDGAVSRALLTRGPQQLGAISYSIYMVHVLVAFTMLTIATLVSKHHAHLVERVDTVATLVGPTWLTTAETLGYLALVVAVASATYRFVELPGQRLFARWAKRGEVTRVAT